MRLMLATTTALILANGGAEMSEQTTPYRCNICGRFMRAVTWDDPETGKTFVERYQCGLVSSDGEGGWEHD